MKCTSTMMEISGQLPMPNANNAFAKGNTKNDYIPLLSQYNTHFYLTFSGKVVCDDILCPTVDCSDPILPEGSCCPICNSEVSKSDQFCEASGDLARHQAGSRWHPYIPPFGFMPCVTCSCNAGNLTIGCERERCPDLECPKEQQVLPHKNTCCKVRLIFPLCQ